MQVRFEVLNAGYYGCPQNRNRIIMLAARKNKRLPDLPTPSHFFQTQNKNLNSFFKMPKGCGNPRSGGKLVLSAPCRFINVNDRIGNLPRAVKYGKTPRLPLHFVPKLYDYVPAEERFESTEMFGTITSNRVINQPTFHPTEDRKLTLHERALVQGFSKRDIKRLYDEYGGKEICTDSKKMLFKQIGNAVPRELAFAIGSAINNSLG
ncbi:S-adenosyl-L-methionine-dependent methyltransferase [Rhizoclosmatium globosum]|uniref:DNA (cytosine-5-)-methyltransferase n=1 Tax=Rhizoclosmatium globosum TaxID=329046 RepID=A0A1Y2CSV1_9FUNG|nr:S-adenosyl-L-methionine-dependent methyltransferase [Rhizoclosmatium globosum]|eukprot:ORY50063.1 S-adenosyl-L-methionine-dependent methyltransferase [Rhizoclosmatium globosum]